MCDFEKHCGENLDSYLKLVTLQKLRTMGKNTSISLGNHFESFVENTITLGRFKNASEVVRAGLRLLEEEETRMIQLRNAIEEGIKSGRANDFDPEKHLAQLKARKKSNG
jgi:antitoxin ParD1/3/4